MIHVIKKWTIILTFKLSDKQITFDIFDDHYSNVLRKLVEVHFQFDPDEITIKAVEK